MCQLLSEANIFYYKLSGDKYFLNTVTEYANIYFLLHIESINS